MVDDKTVRFVVPDATYAKLSVGNVGVLAGWGLTT